jgi:hypothetical protein
LLNAISIIHHASQYLLNAICAILHASQYLLNAIYTILHAVHSSQPGMGSLAADSATSSATAPAPAFLPWLTERRLRLALSSPQGELLMELGVQLSTLAAHCYAW